MEIITTELELPEGLNLSTEGGLFEVKESGAKRFLVIETSPKKCSLFATNNGFGGLSYMQLIQRVKEQGYEIESKKKIDQSVLDMVYEKEKISLQKKGEVTESEIIKNFDEMILAALKEQVSDIHLYKRTSHGEILMRKHGKLMKWKSTTQNYIHDLSSVAYNVLAEDRDVVFDEKQQQAAAIMRVINGISVKLRYQSVPIKEKGCFDAVLRVLPIGKNEEYIPLEVLGYTQTQVEALMEIVSKPIGALIIAGVTGSGKSTTLKNLLMYINASRDYEDKIYTVEDPPEYNIPRVSQIPVVRRKGDETGKSPFQDAIVACMRADPDIIMVGEVRDDQTADLLKKAVQSGHQVLTTLHASSGLSIVERFADFGLKHSILGAHDFIAGLCYQKLVPLICPHCSIKLKSVMNGGDTIRDSDMALFARVNSVCDLDRDDVRLKGPGCEKCQNMGVVGRTVCAEIIAPDLKMLDLFAKGEMVDARKYWKTLSDKDPYSNNMTGKSAYEHGLLKMRKGLISPHDLETAFGRIHKESNE